MSEKVVLVGCGNMGRAMLEGWLKTGRLQPKDVAVVEPADALRRKAADLGCKAVPASTDLAPGGEPALVIFAVKPQVIREVVAEYKSYAGGRTAFLSVAAGTRIATFEEILGSGVPVIRCMPNTPAAIGKGMMVVVGNGKVSVDLMTFVTDLLAASGEVTTIGDESLMDAVTAVSGSGPAYIFHFIECLTVAGRTAGLPEDTAALLAMQTVYGAACLAAESREDPAVLRRQVTSPNGTTAAALEVLMGGDRLKSLLTEAVEAARRRSVELG